jgi:WD40 repeat protein
VNAHLPSPRAQHFNWCDGTRVVTASEDHTARVWNMAGERPAIPLAFEGGVRDAAFSPDGLRLVTASSDNVARIWDTATGAPAAPALVHEAAVRTVAFSPDGKRVVTTSDRTASIWDAMTGQRIASLPRAERVTSRAFSPDGQHVITTSGEGDIRTADTLQLWDVTGKLIPWSFGYPDRFMGAALSSDHTHLVTLNRDRIARIWDATTGTAITPPLAQTGVMSVAFDPTGTRVVTASEEDQTARVWEAASGRLLAPPLEHSRPVRKAAFAPDGGRIVTVSGDGAARVWDATTGKPLTGLLVQDTAIVNAAFRADGALVLTVDSHAVRAWDVALDQRPINEWLNSADRSPYVLKDGVLMLRSIAAGARPDQPAVQARPVVVGRGPPRLRLPSSW